MHDSLAIVSMYVTLANYIYRELVMYLTSSLCEKASLVSK